MSAHRHIGLIAVFELALWEINYGLSISIKVAKIFRCFLLESRELMSWTELRKIIDLNSSLFLKSLKDQGGVWVD